MYTVSVQAHYDSAHFLRSYSGKCARVHGHHYVVEVAVQVDELNESGLAFDFAELKAELRDLAEGLDHQLLNEIAPFTELEPSAENQARYFFEELEKRLPEPAGSGLLFARVWETPTSWALYSRQSVSHPLPPR